MSEISSRIATLSPEQLARLSHELKAKQGSRAQEIPRRREGDHCPLSFSQQRLWFLDQLAPANAAYHVPSALRLSGPLSLAGLKQAFSEIIRRHEVLRTTFDIVDRQPVQVVGPVFDLRLPTIDLQGLNHTEQEACTLKLATQHAMAPFDLWRGPLLRACLLRINEREHVLLAAMHHIVSDGWSLGLLIREVATLYEAFSQGRSSPLPELAIQYADFARWQREWLAGARLQEQLEYWKQQLAEAPILALPSDRPRPSVQSFAGAKCSRVLSESLCAGLKELSRQTGATLYMTMLAGFHALLHRYAQQARILTGTPVANRTAENDPLIGFFVNTLVLSSNFADDPSFVIHLERLRRQALVAYSHQDLPFELLVDELHLTRDLNYNPLFQVMFSWDEAGWNELELQGLEVESVPMEFPISQFDLTLSVGESRAQLRCDMQYNTALFEEATVNRMLGHYEELLHSVVREPQQRVSRLSLLSGGERQQLLRAWHETAMEYESAATLSQLFERQVERDAGAIAVVSGEREVSYGELNERANRVGNYLRELGVGAEWRVGLLLERGVEMVVGLLGIIKAGAAYVPLDPSYPQARLEYMLQDAAVSVVLTERRLQRLASEVAATTESVQTVLSLDEAWAAEAEASGGNLGVTVDSENLAYIIYTSGSTGQPKGVMVTHRNVARLFAATENSFAFDNRDVWTLFHSYAFDFSVWEMWGALLYGGRLVIVPYWVSRSPKEFYEMLVRERVTVLNQTPSAFRQLCQIDEQSTPDVQHALALRLVIFGGEALDFASLGQWFRDHGDELPRLVNMYGITETTVHVTERCVRAIDLTGNSGSLIGRPIADLSGCVLDQYMELLPQGVPGELYVGGAGVARGYLGQPELTAARFVPDPLSGRQGARLYRTGDLVRYRAPDELEYLGRVDQQVKIRGFRIELGEIEAVLKQHGGVREVLVIDRELQREERQLVAYVVGQTETPPTAGELRDHVRGNLPEYMVPSAFVFLPALPLSPSGKIDRRALPLPEKEPAQPKFPSAPLSEIEQTISSVWRQVLQVDEVSVHENFFDIGGHSLLMVQVQRNLANVLEKEIQLVDLFKYSTISSLANYLDENGHKPAASTPGAQKEKLQAGQLRLQKLKLQQAARIR
jgi:amino acid adenylation domain-containing protein